MNKADKMTRQIQDLVDKYFDLIEIEDTNFIDNPEYNLAYLLLNVPTALLKEYSAMKNQKKLPDPAEFWEQTKLGDRLKKSCKYTGQGHEPLLDILEFLEGQVQGNYQELHTPDRIRMSITELPAQ